MQENNHKIMNKLTVVSLPLPITSAILGYNLGWISPVAAQNNNDYSKFTQTAKPFPEVANSNDFYRLNTENHLNSESDFYFSTDNLEKNITNIKTITILDQVVPWQNLDESFSEYFPTQLQGIELEELEELDLNLKVVQPSTITTNTKRIRPEITSDFSHLEQEKLREQRRQWEKSNSEFYNEQPLDTEQSTQAIPTIDNSYSDVAKTESFLVIDNLNTSYDRDAAQISSTTPTFDNPLNQTLAQIEQYNLQNQQDVALEPLTRVSDLRDVKPTDWAYDALKKLVNRFRCFAGYEDNTFKGDRNITRYELATALNICLQKIETIAIEKLPEYFTEEAFVELEKLTKEFEQELIAVQTKTDNLEAKIAFLEEHNFSPTTILRGEIVFQMASAFGDKKAVPTGEKPTEDLDSVVTFGARTRLNFETSFTGRDLLRTRLEGSNLSGYGVGVTGTQMTFLGVSSNTDNRVRIGQIFYRFPLGDKGQAYIAGARQSSSAFIPLLNRSNSISLFGFNNPLYDLGFGAGGGIYYQFSDLIGAGATYYAGSPDNPEPGKGFFNGDFAALAQVTLTPSDEFGISFTYAHFFTPVPRLTTNLTGFTGSIFAQLPFGLETATASDNFNISLSYQVSDRISLGGWVGYITTTAKSTPADRDFGSDTVFLLGGSEGAKANIWTAALTASYNDLGKLGSKLSFILGLPPKLTNNDVPDREDRDTSLHLELSYNYPLTEKISLTPGVLTITSPEHNSKNRYQNIDSDTPQSTPI